MQRIACFDGFLLTLPAKHQGLFAGGGVQCKLAAQGHYITPAHPHGH
jgi:hypothetical protein